MRRLSFRRGIAVAMIMIAGGLIGGCATTAGMKADGGENDPLEGMNRAFYTLNDCLDRAIIGPVAKAYRYLPSPARTGINNFFKNLDEPKTVINQWLQWKPQLAIQDSVRFIFNSTLGIGGLIDVSTAMGLPEHNEDFAQTLAVWGLGEGPHLHYPLLGPGSVREASGRIVDLFSDALFYVGVFPLTVLELIDIRSGIDGIMELQRGAFDPYIFVRESYRQHRDYLIYDGNPPSDDEFDEDEFDPDNEDEG